MTPDQLSDRHPRLFHLTAPDSWGSIKRHGLLPASHLLNRIGISKTVIEALTREPRPYRIRFEDTRLGTVELNDNSPLNTKKLAKCLDGMEPWEWCELLAGRVFFWADEKRGLSRLENASRNRETAREVIVIDTRSFASTYQDQIELCPLNSGSTLYQAKMRGRWLFSRMADYSFEEWSQLRQRKQAELGVNVTKNRDRILEVTVPTEIPDIADFVIERRRYQSGGYTVMPL